YAPYAKGYHVRNALPGNRRALPPEINMHSVKNRFLLRIKNMTGDLYRRNFFSITARDVVVVSCCLLWEHTSLKAFPFLFRNWRNIVAKRREIMSRRRVDDQYIASWFSFEPVAKAAPKKFVAQSQRPKAARR
ncbi:MAG: glycosyltransferase family 2 protein, partial [Acidobacteriota bacterium]|nr:glycosyltransferase family 2 protein [Acidobacteriota bacterium]